MNPLDWITGLFGDIVRDGREKLVEEGFFGRKVPERNGGGDLGWFREQSEVNSPADRAHAPEPPPLPHEQDRGIDR
jgi:hypothetical protein